MRQILSTLLLLLFLNACGTDVKRLLQRDSAWNYQEHTETQQDNRDKACNWIYVGLTDEVDYLGELTRDIKKWLAAIFPYKPLQDCENAIK